MKKGILLLLLLIAFGFLTALGVKAGGCACTPAGNTGNRVGWGNTCTEAQSDLLAQLNQISRDGCDPFIRCNFSTNLSGCAQHRGQYLIVGNADYSCKVCPGSGLDP